MGLITTNSSSPSFVQRQFSGPRMPGRIKASSAKVAAAPSPQDHRWPPLQIEKAATMTQKVANTRPKPRSDEVLRTSSRTWNSWEPIYLSVTQEPSLIEIWRQRSHKVAHPSLDFPRIVSMCGRE